MTVSEWQLVAWGGGIAAAVLASHVRLETLFSVKAKDDKEWRMSVDKKLSATNGEPTFVTTATCRDREERVGEKLDDLKEQLGAIAEKIEGRR
jgi:hypothetical protein